MSRLINIALVLFAGICLGIYIGAVAADYFQSKKLEQHKRYCESSKKHFGHAAYEPDGTPMCFQQSKLSGRVERVSLVIKGGRL